MTKLVILHGTVQWLPQWLCTVQDFFPSQKGKCIQIAILFSNTSKEYCGDWDFEKHIGVRNVKITIKLSGKCISLWKQKWLASSQAASTPSLTQIHIHQNKQVSFSVLTLNPFMHLAQVVEFWICILNSCHMPHIII